MAAVSGRDPEAARPAVDGRELLARAPDRRRVDDRQKLLDVVHEDPVEEVLVAVLEGRQADVLLQRIGLAGDVGVHAPALLVQGRDPCGRSPSRPKASRSSGASGPLRVHRVAQQARAAERDFQAGLAAGVLCDREIFHRSHSKDRPPPLPAKEPDASALRCDRRVERHRPTPRVSPTSAPASAGGYQGMEARGAWAVKGRGVAMGRGALPVVRARAKRGVEPERRARRWRVFFRPMPWVSGEREEAGPMPSFTISIFRLPFSRRAFNEMLSEPGFLPMPCLIAFSTSGWRRKVGTRAWRTSGSTSKDALRRSPKRIRSIARYRSSMSISVSSAIDCSGSVLRFKRRRSPSM